VNVRFIASTNKDLQQLVKEDQFREDLYYRLNVLPIVLPPLRERRSDIDLLFIHFLRSKSLSTGKPNITISENALRILTEYDWPGNVRELENFVERLVAINSNSVIQPKDIQNSIPIHRIEARKSLKDKVLAFEKECILKELVSTNGNRKEAADRLGIHRNTLLNKINNFDLNN
jgi:DNA-binding NtrC family response regulator